VKIINPLFCSAVTYTSSEEEKWREKKKSSPETHVSFGTLGVLVESIKVWFEIFSFSHQITSPIIDVIKNICVQLQWVSWVPSSYQLFTSQ
jgi:hypothetical protein